MLHIWIVCNVIECYLGEADDRGQHVVEVLGDAAGEGADGLHFVDMAKLRFETLGAHSLQHVGSLPRMNVDDAQFRLVRDVNLPEMRGNDADETACSCQQWSCLHRAHFFLQ